jgi:integrase
MKSPLAQLVASARVHIHQNVTAPPLSQVIAEVIASKVTANRRECYVKSLRVYLNSFAKGRESKPLADVEVWEIELWLSKYAGAYTRQTWLNRISTLFSFAVRRGYIAANPCDRIERITVDMKPPVILSPEQAQRLLDITPPHCKPYLVLGLFAGIRPEEIMRLDWSCIDLETKTVKVDGKTRRRRIVPLEPKAVALLSACLGKAGRVSPSASTVRRFKRRVRAALGFTRWPQDLLRHTAASYLLALHGDAGKVAMRLGNSSSILLTHYHEPVKQADCERFWTN